MQNFLLDIVTLSRVVEKFSITSSVDLYQSFSQLSLCWACDWRGWQPGLYLALHKSAAFHALIAVVTGNHLWLITSDAEFFFTVNSWIVVSPPGILREPNWRSMGQDFSILLDCSCGENIEEEQRRRNDDEKLPNDLIPWMNSHRVRNWFWGSTSEQSNNTSHF